MICRLIAPDWLLKDYPELDKVIEGDLTPDQIGSYNDCGYNCYYWPNSPIEMPNTNVNGTHITEFFWVFIDMDLKDGVYKSKEEFIDKINAYHPLHTKIVDSGNGVHVYWLISDLDTKSYLRLQRRLARLFNTDLAVGKICQLMRLEGYNNTKDPNDFKPCSKISENEVSYACEDIDRLLPPISLEDEQFCVQHYNKTYQIEEKLPISGDLPSKFGVLLRKNKEVKSLFSDPTDDRSKNDYRLGHIMLGNGFTKEEAMNVLYNSAKAMQRAPVHRYNYASNIVDKIWTFEETKDATNLSPTVRDILAKGENAVKGTRFPCHKLIDDTEHGFRLGQVIGIIGGSGVGKTTLTLNAFLWFSANNPDYHHFFFSLEQPAGEIASRIRTICGDDMALYDRIHIVSNYNDNGSYNNYSLASIEQHILDYQSNSKNKIGTVVVDHIGVLDKQTKNGENDGLIGICRDMKSVAVRLNVMLIMLSQAPREKAGIGDLELNKDAAYGTVFFESFVDYCLCLWQPLKRAYAQMAPTIMAFKFAKIRHKRHNVDRIKEDVCYQVFFDPATERLRELTQDDEKSITFFLNIATNIRKKDRKTDLITYVSRRIDDTGTNSTEDTSKH